MSTLWEHLNLNCDKGCLYCEVGRLREELASVKNTACKDHTHNNTLRCAICDENRITALENELTVAYGVKSNEQTEKTEKFRDALKLIAHKSRNGYHGHGYTLGSIAIETLEGE